MIELAIFLIDLKFLMPETLQSSTLVNFLSKSKLCILMILKSMLSILFASLKLMISAQTADAYII